MALISPLQMQDFVVYRFGFEVAEDFQRESRKQIGLSARMNVEQREMPGDENKRVIVLRFTLNEEDAEFEKEKFRVLATVAGFFDVEALKAELTQPGEWEGFLLVNGSSMLYTMLRQMVAQAAAQSPLKKLMLQTVNMTELLRCATEQQSEAVEKPKPKARKKSKTN